MTNKDFDKIGKILSDTGKSKLKEFDIVYLIDATGSMAPYIEAAKCTAEDISKTLLQKFPDTSFQYGYVFYRDPIDSYEDIHEIINLTENVNSLPEQIGKIKAKGGGDLPEDWAGAYKIINEEIKWRNGTKVVFHLTDAGAHGKLFTPNGGLFIVKEYPDEEQKLINEINKCCENNIKIFGFVIEENARNSFEKCKEIYMKKGGFYEIYDFNKSKYESNNKSLFAEVNLFGKKEDKINESSSLFGNNNLFGASEENKKEIKNNDKSIFSGLDSNIKKNSGVTNLFGFNNNSNNVNTKSLFGNDKSNNNNKNSLFANNNNSLFGTNRSNIFNESNNNSKSIFENNKTDINNNTNSLFGNNNDNNTKSLFGNIIPNNKTNKPEKNEKTNNNKNSLFANNKDKNELFNNNNEGGLFGNIKDNNNNSNSLFGNVKENDNNNSRGLFENLKNNNDNTRSKEIFNHKETSFQSNLNSSFFNLVVNSIQNINKNEFNLFNNNNSNK